MLLLLLIIVLLIAALIFAYLYAKKQVETSPSIVAAAPHQTPIQTPATIDPPPITLTPKPAVTQAAVAAPIAVTAPTPAAPVTPTSITPEINEAAPIIAEVTSAARIASLAELSTDQRQQLPALKLSMHVYSPEAAKRFAIIDGQRVNEGSVLGTGVIEQIRQDGVVLSFEGQSYLLPRP